MYNIKVFTSVKNLQQNYIVYQIHNKTTLEIEFVGLVKMTNMFQLSDFYQNPMLNKYIKDNEEFHISVYAITENKGEGLRKQSDAIRAAGFPDANKYAKLANTGVIMCHETGVQFRTIREAADAYGIDPTNLSRHLRNVPGHKTVKGYTFSRLNNFTKM